MISFICCCMAICAMIPAAPDSIAGLASFAPGVSICSHFLIEPRWPNIAWLTPCVFVGVSGSLRRSCADFLVSFTQRPELEAISAPACAAEATAVKAAPRRSDGRFDRPAEAMKRSTAVGFQRLRVIAVTDQFYF